MQAYFVHDAKKGTDHIVVPGTDTMVAVDREKMEAFIAVKPQFSQFRGSPLRGLTPQSFGQVIATRDDQGDVCITHSALWQARMHRHLGQP